MLMIGAWHGVGDGQVVAEPPADKASKAGAEEHQEAPRRESKHEGAAAAGEAHEHEAKKEERRTSQQGAEAGKAAAGEAKAQADVTAA